MDKKYDLTNYESYNKATNLLKEYGWIISPLPWLLYKIFSPEVSTEKQVEAAKSLIIAGKENGVKKMKIKVAHKAGVDIGFTYEGIPIKVIAGNEGIVELEIEYA